MAAASNARRLLAIDFEVFGNVQGVFFRKWTEKKSKEYGLVGWVKNTRVSTVVGQIQGEKQGIDQMKVWLSTKGSPKSTITNCEFTNERSISKLDFTDFKIVRESKPKSTRKVK
ncbi:acylphosphatase-1-like [Dendronephthya gigantea]|uniref:acylphosphatase-1-like n=1 Tax=Dendronephthya gigantea TaxID=151771 RepID=UPI00106C7933|nr:acylphosphatase-1-like [Dendronephthya gigantea]